jgi:putative peptidoglycan lipid II flippase
VLVATAALLVPAGGLRLVWLVVAILAGELAAAGMVLTRLRREMRPQRFIEPRAVGGALVAAVAMVPVVAVVWWVQHVYSGGQLSTMAVLTVGGIVAVGVYALVLRATMARRTGAAS